MPETGKNAKNPNEFNVCRETYEMDFLPLGPVKLWVLVHDIAEKYSVDVGRCTSVEYDVKFIKPVSIPAKNKPHATSN